MPKHPFVMVGSVLIAAAILFTPATFSQTTQGNSQIWQDKSLQAHVTVIQKGQATDEEREYSKEYKKIYFYRSSKTISELIELNKARGSKQEIRTAIGTGDPVNNGVIPAQTRAEFLAGLSCKADAIVFGSIKNKTAHLFDDETFVYTQYEFSVESTIKNNSSAPIQINDNIEITRPGGIIKLNDQIVRAEDFSYEPLQKNKEYLLFLRFVPAARGYVVASREGDFVLENQTFKTLSKAGIPEEVSNIHAQSLLNELRDYISSDCGKTLTEEIH